MPVTRSGRMYGKDDARPSAMTADEVVQHVNSVLGQQKQEKGATRKHWIYSAAGKRLVVVKIWKNRWGLILVHEDGRVQQGQYMGRHKFHHQHSSFDGTHFHWDVYYPATWSFMLGKSIAPYWTAVEPVGEFDGWHRRYWGMAGGAIGVMFNLSGITWKQMAPPAEYPVVERFRRLD